MTRRSARLVTPGVVLMCVLMAVAAAVPQGALASGFSALIAEKCVYARGDEMRLCWRQSPRALSASARRGVVPIQPRAMHRSMGIE